MIELDPFRIPLLVAGAATALAGVAAVVLRFPRTAGAILGVILVLKGTNLITAGFMSAGGTHYVDTLLVFQHYLLLPIVPLALYFISVFPKRRGPLAFRGSGYVVLAVIIALEASYAWNHGLVHSIAPASQDDGLRGAGPGWVYTGYGPLAALSAAAAAMYPLLGLVLARESFRVRGAERVPYTFFAIGLTVNGVFDGGLATAYLIHDPAINSVAGFGWILAALHALALLPAGVCVGFLIGSELAKTKPSIAQVWVIAILTIAAWFSGPMPVILGAADYGRTWPTAVAIGFWRTVVALMVGFGLWQLRRLAAPAPAPTAFGARPALDDAS